MRSSDISIGIGAALLLLSVHSTAAPAKLNTVATTLGQASQDEIWQDNSAGETEQDSRGASSGASAFLSESGALVNEVNGHRTRNRPMHLAAGEQDEPGYIEAEELIELFSAEPTTTRSIRGIGGVTAGHAEARKEFQNILFDFDSDRIRQSSHPQLQESGRALGALMRRYPGYSFSIEGHTDSTGDKDYNLHLSHRRAGAVRQYLVNRFGLDSRRITAEGFGEEMPVASNETELGRSRNRRVEIVRK